MQAKVVIEHRDAGLGGTAKTALVEQRIAGLEQRRHRRLVELALTKGADGLKLGLGLPLRQRVDERIEHVHRHRQARLKAVEHAGVVAHGERVVQHVAGLLGNVFLGLHKLTRELVEDHLVGRVAQAGVGDAFGSLVACARGIAKGAAEHAGARKVTRAVRELHLATSGQHQIL